jgi:hypothetical protein
VQGNDLVPLAFPLHTRTHWIDAKTGRLRELEPIILDTFVSLSSASLPLVTFLQGTSVGLCASTAVTYDGTGFPANLGATNAFNSAYNNGFCWSPLRSAATFVTPQDTASLKASVVLICPTADIQQGSDTASSLAGGNTGSSIFHSGGVFNPTAGFPRIQNRDGSTGFPFRSVITGVAPQSLRGRIYDDNEAGPVDFTTPCACLTVTPVLSFSTIYANAPTNLGAFTVPVWYTELEVTAVTSNVNSGIDAFSSQFSFTGYWNLEIAGTPATLFHRMSNASLDNLSFGTNNQYNNR